ncbi:MAG: DUF3536 domain-containing protein, partial [Moorella sp. (in: Bacteria)]|nr:DUF3536 domain-containing protein [Moorella sp. (in: firmicutes)]
YENDEAYQRIVQELTGAFDRADFGEVIRLLDQHFEGATYSLRQLFRDKQRMVLDIILESTLAEAAEDYRRIYDRHAPLMRFLKDLNIPQPRALQAAAEFVLNTSLRQAFASDNLDLERIKALLSEAEMANVPLDGEGLGYVLEQTLKQMAEKLLGQPNDQAFIGHLDAVISLVRSLPFEVNLWKVQNAYYRLLQTVYPEFREKARQGDGEAMAWFDLFNSLGDKLQVRR